MAVINTSGVTAPNGVKKIVNNSELASLIFLESVKNSPFATFHKVFTGIKSGQKIPKVGGFAEIGHKGRGCSPATDTEQLLLTELSWLPKEIDARLAICYVDLASTIFEDAVNAGVDITDLTDLNNPYVKLLTDEFTKKLNDLYWRIHYFGDEDASNYKDSPPGFIKNGEDPTLFTAYDGILKQAMAIGTATPARRYTIAANSQATTAAQLSITNFTLAHAKEIMDNLFFNCTSELAAAADSIIICTRTVGDRYLQYLQSIQLQPAFEMMVNGVMKMTFNGVAIYSVPYFDKIRAAYFDNGTKIHIPHFALRTTIDNIPFATDSKEMPALFKLFNNDVERKTYLDFIMKGDSKIVDANLIQIAF